MLISSSFSVVVPESMMIVSVGVSRFSMTNGFGKKNRIYPTGHDWSNFNYIALGTVGFYDTIF